MGTITVPPISNGDSLDANPIDTNFNTIVNEFNGSIDNTNLSPSAAIALSKLAATLFTSYTPTFGGFSAAPTVVARWFQIAKMVTLTVAEVSAGTSNATTFTISLPFTPKTSQTIGGVRIKDNGGYSTTQGAIAFTASNTTASVFRDMTGTSFTTSGGKACDFSVTLEVQ